MAPTSQSGFPSEDDRMGPESPGVFRSGFRGEARADCLLVRNEDQKEPTRNSPRFSLAVSGKHPRRNPLQHVCKA
eukprot:5223726-Pyramimonas_sp.AAC.1